MEGTAFGRYRLIEVLGRGGMGEVWRAFDTVTNRVVALKLLPAHLADDQTFQERFRREAQAAAGLNNPHVIPIHDFGEIDGRLFVSMRLIEGRDLDAVLADGPLDPIRAVHIVVQVAKALHAAHRVRLVHRDIKPSNILLDEDDFAYLIDFGIARAAGEAGLTTTGGLIGTLHYMAPERFSTGVADARSDIYALACVLYESLTGQRPYPGDSFEQQIAGHLSTPPPRPSTINPQVSSAFDSVIAKGMAKDPDDRYRTTVELAHASQNASTAPISRAESTFRQQRLAEDSARADFGITVADSNPTQEAESRPDLAPTQRASTAISNSPTDATQLAPVQSAPRRNSRVRLAVVPIILALGLAGAAAFAVIETRKAVPVKYISTSSEWQPYVDAGARFAKQMFSYERGDEAAAVQATVAGSTGSLRNMLTSEGNVDKLTQMFRDTNASSVATVDSAGLESFDSSTATVLVAVSVQVGELPSTRYRLRVFVVKEDGVLKVSDLKYPDGGN